MKFLLHSILAFVPLVLFCVVFSVIYHDLLFNTGRNSSGSKTEHREGRGQDRNMKSIDDSKLQKVLSRNHHINNLRTSWGSTEFVQKDEHISVGGDSFLLPLIAPEKSEALVVEKHNHHFRRRRWRQRQRSRGWSRRGKGFIYDDDSSSGSSKRSSKSKVGKSKSGMSKGKKKSGSKRCGGSSKKSSKKSSSKKKGKGGGKGYSFGSVGRSGKGKGNNSERDDGKGNGKGKGSYYVSFEGRSGKGKGDSSDSDNGKGKGKGRGKGNGMGSSQGKGKGKGKGYHSSFTGCDTNFDDDIGLAAPVAPVITEPVLPPSTAPMAIIAPSTPPLTLAPAPMTTSQPTALAPTSSSMGPTPERGLIRIRVSNWYIAYRAPDATTRAPTRMEYDAILESTRMYIENYFLNYFQTNMLDMIRYVSSESLLTTASYGTDVPSFVQQPSPNDDGRFNIYVNFRYIEFVYYDTSTPIPDEAQSYDLLQSALLTNPDEQTYIMEVPQMLSGTPFESTIDIVFGTVP